ncbi:MAG: hypothetical protein GX086_01465 [Alcaligenaceae bacterium]|nr:hypothetical protein [Alcaligenaceae bacterium]
MQQFVVYRLDRTDGKAEDIRATTRPLHIEYMKAFRDRVHIGGPLLDGEGRPVGGVMVIDAATREEVEQMVANDPFELAGLSSVINIHVMRWQTNRPATLPPL